MHQIQMRFQRWFFSTLKVIGTTQISFGAVFSIVIIVIKGATQLECDTYQCVGQQVQYQCNVTQASILLWRVINDSVILEDLTYNTGSPPSSSADVLTDTPEFSTILSSTSSTPQMIVSSIVFTGQTSINGYTIECDDLGGDKETCPIVIPGIPSSPDNVTIHTDTFTNSSVNISWTESSSPCVTGYRYNISSSALEENIIMESTSNSVMVEGLVPSDDQYCVVVTAIDTGNRTSSGSDPVCFIFNVPNNVNQLIIFNDTVVNSNITIEVTVEWEEPKFNNVMSDTIVIPVITGYEVSIVNATDSDSVNMTVLLSASSLEHTFTGVPTGRTYTITVKAINGVGRSSTIEYLKAPGLFYHLMIPTPTSASVTQTSFARSSAGSSSIPFIPSSSSKETCTCMSCTVATSYVTVTSVYFPDDKGLSSSVSAGISVAITVPVTAVITAIITVIILYLYQRRVNKQSSNKATPPQDYETPISTNEVEMKGNTAYGQVNAKTSTTFPTGREYESVYM